MIIILYIIFLFYMLNTIYNLDNYKIFTSKEKNIIKYLLIIVIIINIIEYLQIFNFNISYILDIIISIYIYFYIRKLSNFIKIYKYQIVDRKIISKEKLDNIIYNIDIIYYILLINLLSILINYFYIQNRERELKL